MSNKKSLSVKTVSILLVLVLLVGLAAGGTVAWLIDGTEKVVNTFTYGDINIDLTETDHDNDGNNKENDYEMIPGSTIAKDPVLTVKENSESAWLFVKLEETGGNVTVNGTEHNFDSFLEYSVNNTLWAALEGEDNVYYCIYDAAQATGDVEFPVLLNNQVTVKSSVTKEMVNALDNSGANTTDPVYPKLTITGYAVQKENMADAATAWAAVNTYVSDQTPSPDPAPAPWDGTTVDTTWYDASATEFTLDSAAEVAGLAELVNDGNSMSGKTIKLAADIDLGGNEWTPIGQTGGYSATTYFQGNFDGQGYTISNMTIRAHELGSDEGKNYASGFFGFLDCGQSGSIKDINFDKATVYGHHWTGVVAGYTSGTVSGCKVTNSVINCTHLNDEACGDKAGTITGYINGTQGKVENCSADNCTVTAGRDAGQIVGAAVVSQVTGCSATNVTATAAGDCTGANINNAVIGRVL